MPSVAGGPISPVGPVLPVASHHTGEGKWEVGSGQWVEKIEDEAKKTVTANAQLVFVSSLPTAHCPLPTFFVKTAIPSPSA